MNTVTEFDGKGVQIERGLVYYTAEHAAEKAKAMAGIDPRTTNRGEA